MIERLSCGKCSEKRCEWSAGSGRSSRRISPRTSRNQRGYALLTILLGLALMAIFAGALASSLKFTIQRDREEELIHRGVQYSRAIRVFYKKFGRYPVSLDELENTNQMRFLRKRYKDPMNCKLGKCQDFKLLHYGEVQMSMSGIGGGGIAGATSVSQMAAGAASSGAFGQSSSAFGQSGSFGQSSSGFSSSGFGSSSTFGSSSFGSGSSSSFGSSNGSFGSSSNSSSSQNQTSNSGTGTDSTTSGTQSSDSSSSNSPSATGNGSSNSANGQPGQIIGGPIVGVATTNKDRTIREYNHKKKYNDWAFIYDPGQDMGFLITTPYQPMLQAAGSSTANLNGQSPINNSNNAFGISGSSSSGFGSSSFGNSFSGGQNNSGFGSPAQPSNPQPQQPQQPQQQ